MEEREPCPWRIIDDSGSAFMFGVVGGSVWHFFKGGRNAPKGLGHRLYGAFNGVVQRAPVLGGNFAVWGCLFSAFDCSLASVRKVEDPWNPILAGAATGGLLAARAGAKAVVRNALAGAVILALIEGLQIVIVKQSTKMQLAQMKAQAEAMGQEFKMPDEDTLEPPVAPPTWTAAGTLSSAETEDTFDTPYGGGAAALR